jgi:hypothetical protein
MPTTCEPRAPTQQSGKVLSFLTKSVSIGQPGWSTDTNRTSSKEQDSLILAGNRVLENASMGFRLGAGVEACDSEMA